jgi:hypothetical protein
MDVFEYAEKTTVFEHPDTGRVIVLAHPGQQLNRDPKYLRENFGLAAHHQGDDCIKKLSESSHAPLTDIQKAEARGRERAKKKIEEQAAERAEQEAYEKALAEAEAGAKPARGKAAGLESTPAKE